jgi:ribonuclease P protein component
VSRTRRVPLDANMPRPFAFDRPKRLVKSGDFQRAFQEGARARGAVLLVVARRNDVGSTRLGLSVGKSVWKSAVRRNRVRRIFREAFRLEFPALPVGFDLVLVAAAPRLEPELAATRAELVRLAHKAARRVAEKAAGAADPRAPSERPTPGGQGRGPRGA